MLIGIDGYWVNAFGWSLPSYPTLIGFVIFIAGLISITNGRRFGIGFGVDSLLAGLALGLLLARAEHVFLHWDYFSAATAEITDLKAGGLGWAGALLGGVLGVWLMAKIRGRNGREILEVVALAIPLLFFGGWWACEVNACAYGAEVANLADYPAAWVWEAPGDYGMLAPRWRTQGIGMGASLIIFGLLYVLVWRGWLKGWRFSLAVGLSIVVMLGLNMLRGDLP